MHDGRNLRTTAACESGSGDSRKRDALCGLRTANCELRAAVTGRPLLVFRVFHEAGLAEAGLQVFPFHAPFGRGDGHGRVVVRRFHVEDAADEFVFQVVGEILVLIGLDGFDDVGIALLVPSDK